MVGGVSGKGGVGRLGQSHLVADDVLCVEELIDIHVGAVAVDDLGAKRRCREEQGCDRSNQGAVGRDDGAVESVDQVVHIIEVVGCTCRDWRAVLSLYSVRG